MVSRLLQRDRGAFGHYEDRMSDGYEADLDELKAC